MLSRSSTGIVLCIALLFAPLLQAEINSTDNGAATGVVHGAAMPQDGRVLPLKQAIENLSSHQNQSIKVSGTVTKVCRKKGCWMILIDNDAIARVTFADYSFFVPTDTLNQQGVVYGVLSENTLSEDMAKHYAQDEGKAASSVSGPRKEYSIVARSVYLESKH